MNIDDKLKSVEKKNLPKEYIILELRLSFNNELYKKEIISYDIFNKMQRLLIQKMNKILRENT
ncbi:MAG: hypothetical protein OSJ65_06350 [Bacilli bacterium]|nr:hypothetical protein [Bacilli bacterium]